MDKKMDGIKPFSSFFAFGKYHISVSAPSFSALKPGVKLWVKFAEGALKQNIAEPIATINGLILNNHFI